jgi:hypothetical protein
MPDIVVPYIGRLDEIQKENPIHVGNTKVLATTGNKRSFPNKNVFNICSVKSTYWLLSLVEKH